MKITYSEIEYAIGTGVTVAGVCMAAIASIVWIVLMLSVVRDMYLLGYKEAKARIKSAIAKVWLNNFSKFYTTEEEAEIHIWEGWNNKDMSCGERCYHCHRKLTTTRKVKDHINGIECEVEYRCATCNKPVGYWAYGAWKF